jgi:hypothetical protein
MENMRKPQSIPKAIAIFNDLKTVKIAYPPDKEANKPVRKTTTPMP